MYLVVSAFMHALVAAVVQQQKLSTCSSSSSRGCLLSAEIQQQQLQKQDQDQQQQQQQNQDQQQQQQQEVYCLFVFVCLFVCGSLGSYYGRINFRIPIVDMLSRLLANPDYRANMKTLAETHPEVLLLSPLLLSLLLSPLFSPAAVCCCLLYPGAVSSRGYMHVGCMCMGCMHVWGVCVWGVCMFGCRSFCIWCICC